MVIKVFRKFWYKAVKQEQKFLDEALFSLILLKIIYYFDTLNCFGKMYTDLKLLILYYDEDA